jgi:hypothetical protein
MLGRPSDFSVGLFGFWENEESFCYIIKPSKYGNLRKETKNERH